MNRKETAHWIEYWTEWDESQFLPSEDADAETCFHWVTELFPDLLIFHPVNESGGGRNPQYEQKLNAMGRVKGIMDYILLETFGPYPHAVIELKRRNKKKSRLKPEQKEQLERARRKGAFCAVCWGPDAFKACIHELMMLKSAHAHDTMKGKDNGS